MRGHFAKAKVEPKRRVAEFRVSADNLIDVGAELAARILSRAKRSMRPACLSVKVLPVP